MAENNIKEKITINEENGVFKIVRNIEEKVEPGALLEILKQIRQGLMQAEERRASLKKNVDDSAKKLKENSLNREEEKIMTTIRKGNKYDEAKRQFDDQSKQLEGVIMEATMLKDRLNIFTSKALKAEELVKKGERKGK